jgi:hypothetical protein
MFFAIVRYAAIHSNITRYVILTKEGSIKILKLHFATFRMTTKSYLSFTLIRERKFFVIKRLRSYPLCYYAVCHPDEGRIYQDSSTSLRSE